MNEKHINMHLYSSKTLRAFQFSIKQLSNAPRIPNIHVEAPTYIASGYIETSELNMFPPKPASK